MRPDYTSVLSKLDLLPSLAEFTPAVIGTPPLDIALPSSDIDIACHAPDESKFHETVSTLFGRYECFSYHRMIVRDEPSYICNFFACGWEIEIFAQNTPVSEQYGYRHYIIEKRLLELFGARLKSKIIDLKANGMKTEPAFASVLRLNGDPYVELLRLEEMADHQIMALAEKSEELRN